MTQIKTTVEENIVLDLIHEFYNKAKLQEGKGHKEDIKRDADGCLNVTGVDENWKSAYYYADEMITHLLSIKQKIRQSLNQIPG